MDSCSVPGPGTLGADSHLRRSDASCHLSQCLPTREEGLKFFVALNGRLIFHRMED